MYHAKPYVIRKFAVLKLISLPTPSSAGLLVVIMRFLVIDIRARTRGIKDFEMQS